MGPVVPRPEMHACGMQAYFDGRTIHCELPVAAGVDSARVRLAIEAILRQAAAGTYWGGRAKHFDLDERWHVLRVEVSESESAGIGGGPLSAPDDMLTAKRHLVAAALAYISEAIPDVD